jgi:RNase H-fold protein (predicted Holliday junction resolvase)
MSKANSTKSKTIIPRYRSKRPNLFGPPLLLVGEDCAAYDELHARIREAVKPIDFIDEMFAADLAFLVWDVLRGRRLKTSLLRGFQVEALENFLNKELHFSLYAQDFATQLASTLETILPKDQAHTAKQLADAFARYESDANERVNKILAGRKLRVDDMMDSAQQRKAKELAQKYARREPDAVRLVDEILTGASVGIDDLANPELVNKFEDFEKIDRLTHIAENRRNTTLREIDRHRAVRGETRPRNVTEVED